MVDERHRCQSASKERMVCDCALCAGCMACVAVCPCNAITVVDGIEHYDARIDADKCIECGLCHSVCQQLHPSKLQETVDCWQGWASSEIRYESSSGGFATAIMRAFIAEGGLVASCKFVDGRFGFTVARSHEELAGFTGSKYVKSDPSGIYEAIIKELGDGSKVLFIGLPCQVSAVKNYVELRGHGRLSQNLFTIDLICHGTPSEEILKQDLAEYGYELGKVQSVKFRDAIRYGISVDGSLLVPAGSLDRYLVGFLAGLFYTRNCYSCHYATAQRVGDLTLGDSWGSELSDELPAGISLALIQSEKGRMLLEAARVNLLPVDYANAVRSNAQLHSPTKMGDEREVFFTRYEKAGSVRKAVFAALPRESLKQLVKGVLHRARG